MTKDEALKLALEALEDFHTDGYRRESCYSIITALRQALEQPEQEPVAWEIFALKFGNGTRLSYVKPENLPSYLGCRPLYTSPPQRKPLTDEMTKQMRESCDSYEMRGAFVDGWLSAEAAHGIKGEA